MGTSDPRLEVRQPPVVRGQPILVDRQPRIEVVGALDPAAALQERTAFSQVLHEGHLPVSWTGQTGNGNPKRAYVEDTGGECDVHRLEARTRQEGEGLGLTRQAVVDAL